MSAMLQTRIANNPQVPKTSFRERIAEPARLVFAAIAAFLQSLLQTRGSFASQRTSLPGTGLSS